MRTLVAALALSGAYVACVAFARALRPRAAILTPAVAAALLVCVEAVLLYALSAFQAVTAPGLLAGQLAIVAAGAAVSRRSGVPVLRVGGLRRGLATAPGRAVAFVGLLALAASLAYRPNNADSLSYHLARVVQWIENQSVGVYAVRDARQITQPPGAEYLILVLQGIARSERLANLVQFCAWVILALSGPPLARAFGAPRWIAPWAGLVALAPMAVLQASSTQNDLVAAAMGLAILGATLPFLHRRARWRGRDVAVLGATLAAGYLVKPTSILAVAPFVAWGFLLAVRSLGRATPRRLAGAGIGLAVVAAVVGPFAAIARSDPDRRSPVDPFLYLGLAEPGDRLVNAMRGLVRELPVPASVADLFSPALTAGCPIPGSLCAHANRAFTEDAAGNPGVALVVVAALVVAAFRWRAIPLRGRAALALLPVSWLLAHALFRDNPWITRLHLPMLALAPTALAAVPRVWASRRAVTALLLAGAAAITAHGIAAARWNDRRPLDARFLERGRSEDAWYYPDFPKEAALHRAALAWLDRTGCRRLAILISVGIDYPLAWRAVQRGVSVRHDVGPDAWPCAVYSEEGPPPAVPGAVWRETDVENLWGRESPTADAMR